MRCRPGKEYGKTGEYNNMKAFVTNDEISR
jgi:hypothetical protein